MEPNMISDADSLQHLILGIWNEHALEKGETRNGQVAGYPIHTVNGVTLVAAPVEVPADFYDETAQARQVGIAYCFVNEKRQVVDNFEGERNYCKGRMTSFDEFYAAHGAHFADFAPRHVDFSI